MCLDVGCGGGDVTFEITRATGLTGRVVGVDLDGTILDLARREAEQQKLSNVTFEVQDVTTWESGELFDVVSADPELAELTQRLFSAFERLVDPI